MKTKIKSTIINAPADQIFQFMSDFSNISIHNTNHSILPMGSRLALRSFSHHKTELGSVVRWKGKVLGMKVDYKETITRLIVNREKEWETVSGENLPLYEWYKIRITVLPAEKGTYVEVGMKYKKAKGFLKGLLAMAFADMYAAYCINKMLYDTSHFFEENYQLDLKPTVTN